MKVLVINCGSSSIKYQIFTEPEATVVASGLVERIGESDGRLKHRWRTTSGIYEEVCKTRNIADHRAGFSWIGEVNAETGSITDSKELFGIGHRVVHGGEVFKEPSIIDNDVIKAIREMIPLAPLHNPTNLTGIEVVRERWPHVPQVAVFDTAFHQSMPPHAYLYALPYSLYTDNRVRRYGFHGTSHYYIAQQASRLLGKPLDSLNLITLHLGNGASAAAIKAGKCIDTSMGMTPLEGLIMGTRSGDLDPAIHFYLSRTTGMSSDELESLFNRESGLKGICGANDMREIMGAAGKGDQQARLAIEMYCYRIKKYVGAYCAVLGEIHALVFTGGIGENNPLIREKSCEGLSGLGIIVDDEKNNATRTVPEIQADNASVKVLVIPTNEELEIARQTVECIRAQDR